MTEIDIRRQTIYERCRAYTIVLRVIDESSLQADEKDSLIAQMMKPILASWIEVDGTQIRQALDRGSAILKPGTAAKPAKNPEVEWVLRQRKKRPRARRAGRK
jgi:hypothetical protein